MIKGITTLKKKTFDNPTTVFDELFAIQHTFFEISSIIYESEDSPTLKFFLSEDGNYGEIHVHWDNETVFENWKANQVVQTMRQTYEVPFHIELQNYFEVKRYIDDSIVDQDPSRLALDSYVSSGGTLTEIIL